MPQWFGVARWEAANWSEHKNMKALATDSHLYWPSCCRSRHNHCRWSLVGCYFMYKAKICGASAFNQQNVSIQPFFFCLPFLLHFVSVSSKYALILEPNHIKMLKALKRSPFFGIWRHFCSSTFLGKFSGCVVEFTSTVMLNKYKQTEGQQKIYVIVYVCTVRGFTHHRYHWPSASQENGKYLCTGANNA